MAGDGAEGIIIVSSSSSASSEDEEELSERSQKSKLREAYHLPKCPGREACGKQDEDDDCVALRKDPFAEGEAEEVKAIVDLSRKLSLSPGDDDHNDTSSQHQAQRQEHESEDEDDDEVSIVGERGEVALRDFPHARHLCATFPFCTTPHESYCDKCYCYVCDRPAPCEQWKESSHGHCNATEQDEVWKKLRKAYRLDPQAEVLLHSGQSF